MFIEVTVKRLNEKISINVDKIVSFKTNNQCDGCLIETVIDNGPHAILVKENYEEVQEKLIWKMTQMRI